MTIIVTGGAGFIGSNFVFHMLNKYPDYRIVCLDCLTYAGNLSTLAPVMGNPTPPVPSPFSDPPCIIKLLIILWNVFPL